MSISFKNYRQKTLKSCFGGYGFDWNNSGQNVLIARMSINSMRSTLFQVRTAIILSYYFVYNDDQQKSRTITIIDWTFS